jgi:hypothetical protein
MRLPAFTAEASLQRSSGTYRGRTSLASSRSGVRPQLTPRPDRPGRPPHPFPPFGPWDQWAQPTYCDRRCLDECTESMRRECGADALCVVELMPVCRNNCCVWGH